MTLSLAPLTDVWSKLLRFSSAINLSWLSRQYGISAAGASRDALDAEKKLPDNPLPKPQPPPPLPDSIIQKLLNSPTLFDPIRKPRNPIVLCHGLYGFDVWGPSQFPTFQRHYWSDVLETLRGVVGAEVVVTSVPSTGSIEDRAKTLDKILNEKAKGRTINFLAHSMGGLDCRHLITHIQPKSYTPASLTTIATPHKGSPFMDWCLANIGVGSLRGALATSQRPLYVPYSLKSPLFTREPLAPESPGAKFGPSAPTAADTTLPLLDHLLSLPKSLTTLILSLIDEPAYANLTTGYLRDYFNPNTPNVPGVRYYSAAGRVNEMNIFHPLWLPKVILDKAEEVERDLLTKVISEPSSTGWQSDTKGFLLPQRPVEPRPDHEWGNDGLVPISSAKWGEFLGTVDNCDHWEIRGASGFANSIRQVGEAGGLGWVKGADWSNWGSGWWDSETPNGHSQPTTTIKEKETTEFTQREKDAMSNTMSWVGKQLSEVSSPPSGPEYQSPSQAEKAMKPLEMPELSAKSPKFDLKRFYVALSKKLYEDGL